MSKPKRERRSPGEGSVFEYKTKAGVTRYGIKFLVVQADGRKKSTLRRRSPNGEAWTKYTDAAMTGMRCGELLALRWKDVDLDAGTISVRRSVSLVRAKGEKQRTIEGAAPEISASRRRPRSGFTTFATLTPRYCWPRAYP